MSPDALMRAYKDTLAFFMKQGPFNRLSWIRELFMFIQVFNELISTNFPWSIPVISPVRKFTQVISLDHAVLDTDVFTPSAFFIIFGIVAFGVISTFLALVYAIYLRAFHNFNNRTAALSIRFAMGTIQAFSVPVATILLRLVAIALVGKDATLINIAGATKETTSSWLDSVNEAVGLPSSAEAFVVNHADELLDETGDLESLMIGIGTASSLVLLAIIVSFSFMHSNDPLSTIITRRTGSRLEMWYSISGVAIVFWRRILPDNPEWIAFPVLAWYLILFVSHIETQPFYCQTFNHIRSAGLLSVCWVALCAGAVSVELDARDKVGAASTLFLLPIVFYIGYSVSRMRLYSQLVDGLRQRSDAELILDTTVFEEIQKSFVPGIKNTWRHSFAAAKVEVATRFLLLPTDHPILREAFEAFVFHKRMIKRQAVEFALREANGDVEENPMSSDDAFLSDKDRGGFQSSESDDAESGGENADVHETVTNTLFESKVNVIEAADSGDDDREDDQDTIDHGEDKNDHINSDDDDDNDTTPLYHADLHTTTETKQNVDAEEANEDLKALEIEFIDELLDRAETHLRHGLLAYPQSIFLRMQYLAFLIAHRRNYSLALVRHSEFLSLPIDWDLQYTLSQFKDSIQFQMRKGNASSGGDDNAVDHSMSHNNNSNLNGDSISFEEMKKTHKLARRNHHRARIIISLIWFKLGRGKVSSRSLTGLISKLNAAETLAMRSYRLLLGRNSDSTAAIEDMAEFLRYVKMDQSSADALLGNKSIDEAAEERKKKTTPESMGVDQDGKLKKGVSGESVEVASSNLDKQEKQKHARVEVFRLRLRFISLILIAALFLIMFVSMKQLSMYTTANLNIIDSGLRRKLATSAAYFARGMHISAIELDSEQFRLDHLNLKSSMTQLQNIHTALTRDYPPLLQRHLDWYSKPSVIVTRVLPQNILTNQTVNGYDAIAELVEKARLVAEAKSDRFTSFDKTKPYSFSEYFFVLQNALTIARFADFSTCLYQQEASDFIDSFRWITLLSASIFSLFELLIGILLFRPMVIKVLHEFDVTMVSLKSVSTTRAQLMFDVTSTPTIRKEISKRYEKAKRMKDLVKMTSMQDTQYGAGVTTGASSTSTPSPLLDKKHEIDENHEEESGQKVDKEDAESISSTDEKSVERKDVVQVDIDVDDDDDNDEEDNEGVDTGMTNSMAIFKRKRRSEYFNFVVKWRRFRHSRTFDVTSTFILCFAVIVLILFISAFRSIESSEKSNSYLSAINAAGRRRYLAHRTGLFAREIVYFNNASTSIATDQMTYFKSMDVVKTCLKSSVRALLATHYFLIRDDSVFQHLPREFGWDTNVDPDMECSPFSMDRDLYNSSVQNGAIDRSHDTNVYFLPNCLTLVEWKDEQSWVSKHPRVAEHIKPFDSSKCVGFRNKDVLYSYGFHRLLFSLYLNAESLSQSPILSLKPSNSQYRSVMNAENGAELGLGAVKSVIYYEYQAISIVATHNRELIFFTVGLCLQVLAQYFIFGNRMEKLISRNIGMSYVIERLVKHAERTSKSKHYAN